MTSLPYLVGFDTETTGVSVFEDCIVTASIVYIGPDGEIIENYEWLINPGVPIAEGASAVHGITNEHAQEYGADPVRAVYEIGSTLAYFMSNGVPIVAYNASFDFSLLNSEIVRHLGPSGYTGFEDFFSDRIIPKCIIDPYVIDKKMHRFRSGSRTLTKTAEFYGISLENAHASYDDCLAAGGVARALWERYPVLVDGPLDELYDLQVEWYREQQQGLEDHFLKTDREFDNINKDWPIRRRDDDSEVQDA